MVKYGLKQCRQFFSLAVCLVFVCQLFAAALPAAAQEEEEITYLLNETFDTIPQESEKETRPIPSISDWGAEKPSGVMELDNGWLAYVQKNGASAQSELHVPLMPGMEAEGKSTPGRIMLEFDWKAAESDTSVYIRDNNKENLFRLNYNGSKINYQYCKNGGTPSGSNTGKSVNLSGGIKLRLALAADTAGHAVIQKAWVNGQEEGISSVTNSTVSGSAGFSVLILSPKGKTASLLGKPLTEIDNLKVWEQIPEKTKADVTLVGGSKIAEGGRMNVNVHVQSQGDAAASVEFDLKYDSALLTYLDVQPGWSADRIVDLTVAETEKGTLHMKVSDNGKGMPKGTVKNYAATRAAKLDFSVAEIETAAREAQVTVENINCLDKDGKPVNEGANKAVPLSFTVYAGDPQDLNGDGVIGAGDAAMAQDEATRKAIAANAKIQPYKRVVTIVTDGAGNSFHPGTGKPPYDGPYYNGTKTVDEARKDSAFGMWLHNEYMATSYSTRTIDPPSSCQNYNTFLHGVGTYGSGGTVPSEYKVDNDSAHANYYPDFGKAEAKYPSIYKTINDKDPSRKLAGFAAYASIIDGVVEIDSGAYTRRSTGFGEGADRLEPDEHLAAQLADYIRSGEMKNTAFTFYVLDDMDGYGHLASSDGWFGDKFYETQNVCSRCYERVYDALKETDMLDDTLFISTADHGGTTGGHAHGNNSRLDNTIVYFGLGGQTVDSGKRLTGGETTDLGAIVLNTLGYEKPASMRPSEDFTRDSANDTYLSQEELAKKNRDVERISYTRSGKEARITLENAKQDNQVKVVDLMLEGAAPAKVETEGRVLYQKDGRLILGFEDTPETVCSLTYDAAGEAEKVGQVMLGTAGGKEIYCDLSNIEKDWAFIADGQEVDTLAGAAGKELAVQCMQGTEGRELFAALYDQRGILVQVIRETEAELRFAVPASGISRIQVMVWGADAQDPCAKAGTLQ